jgi:hypothetical protein
MTLAIHLHHEFRGRAVEIHRGALERVLKAKLEPIRALSQDLPEIGFRQRQ